ncbi:MAG TPA: tyrosine-type recombinase/integrase [Planctomycetota bacterium]|nr:tyrosine-type recombinase/integrase [Planctomycetota bacterium]
MVKITSKGREGAPSCAVDSLDCTGMRADDNGTTATTEKARGATSRLPKMTKHSSGQARVRLNGKTHYLGVWGTPASHKRYAELLEEWNENGREPIGPRAITANEAILTVRELSAQYQAWIVATGRFLKHRKETSRRRLTRRVLTLFEEFAGAVPVRRLKEALLVHWRDRIEADYPDHVRKTINRWVWLVKDMLRWGESRGLVPKPVWLDCASLSNLKPGQCSGRPEHGKRARRAVPVEDIELVAAHCCSQVAAMMRLQLKTSMRPGDVCLMRWADINKNGPNGTWIYTVEGAKTEHLGHVTRYLLGKEAQAILERFPALPKAFIFSPAKRMADRHAAGRRRKQPMRRRFNDRWNTVAYRLHVKIAAAKAGVEDFTNHELRHTAVTRVVNEAGIAAASAAANHKNIATTSRYYHSSAAEQVRAVRVLDQIVGAS